MSRQSLLVTGASGQLGRRVLDLLLAQNAGPIIATTRNPDSLKEYAAKGVEVRRADFENEADLSAAFQGAGRALLISTDALDRPGRRIAQQKAAVRALEAAGVKHAVYTSLSNPYRGSPIGVAADHLETEEALAASSLEFTILRNNLYAETLLFSLPSAVASGQLITARGTGAVAYVTREDCARVAAAALVEQMAGRHTFEVTGSAALTSQEIAALASELSGRKIAHVSVPANALIQGMVAHGMPQHMAELFASFDVGIAKGDLSGVSDTVQRLTGRAPQTVRDFLAANRAALRSAA